MQDDPTAATARPSLLRALPSVDHLLATPELAALALPTPTARALGRDVVAGLRQRILDGSLENPDALARALDVALAQAIATLTTPRLRRLYNGTGVLVHTNAGRAPLSAQALAAIVDSAAGYANLELDLSTGARGSRQALLRPLLRWISGADDGIVVNNGAAALMLSLSALACGRPVIVSRGELVEIGGSFRVPDVMAAAGVQLVEVGTTNRTHAADYATAVADLAAAGRPAALLLQVHRSNFEQVGFVATPAVAELAAIAQRANVPLVCDLGAGALPAMAHFGVDGEPELAATLAAGADLVTASGDKLLGGPQAGLILGRADLVATAAKAPMARALRPCGLTLAALDATLRSHLRGDASDDLPLWSAIARPIEGPNGLQALGEGLLAVARAVCTADATGAGHRIVAELVASEATIGGGSQAGQCRPSLAIALRDSRGSSAALANALRGASPPWIARIRHDAVLLDLRSLCCGSDDATLRSAFTQLCLRLA